MPELDFLRERAEGIGEPRMRHLTSPLALRDYARIADQTVASLRGNRVLDWGCGYGQLSYLLARRGIDATAYDVGPAIRDGRLPLAPQLKAVRGSHHHGLPFRSGAFDAVLACGVLEHVADMGLSLEEIHRVLVPRGQLFVYNLPNRYSYKEAVIERLGAGYTHERRYTPGSIGTVLRRHRFEVVSVARAGVVPHLATGLPPGLRRAYLRLSPQLFALDRALSRTPGVNLLAQSIEVVAQRA